MPYVVAINMSYDHHTQEQCAQIWKLITKVMLDAGFQPDGRLFTINLPEKDATLVARNTIDKMASELRERDENIYDYLKRCYGYDVAHTTNLLLPPLDTIEVEEKTDPA